MNIKKLEYLMFFIALISALVSIVFFSYNESVRSARSHKQLLASTTIYIISIFIWLMI